VNTGLVTMFAMRLTTPRFSVSVYSSTSGWPSSDAETPKPVVNIPSKSDWSMSSTDSASYAPAIQKVGPEVMRSRICFRIRVIVVLST